jgi:WD40 repeat protein
MIATISSDGTARVWSVDVARQFPLLGIFAGHDGDIIDAEFNPTSSLLATAGSSPAVP